MLHPGPVKIMNNRPDFVAHYRETDAEWQSLEAHLSGVARLAGSFAAKLNLAKQGELLGLLHDLGKYSQAFQVYLKSATGQLNQDEDEEWVDAERLRGKIDHSTAGAQFAWHELGSNGQIAQKIAAQVLALCVASHHSGLIDCIAADETRFGEDIFTKRMRKTQEKTYLDEVKASADPVLLKRCVELLAEPGLVTGISQVLESIKRSNMVERALCSRVILQQFGLVVRFLFSCLIDADRIDTADFERPRAKRLRSTGEYVSWPALIQRLESHLETLEPRCPIDGLRRTISEHCRQAAGRPGGIYTLTVPTGGGKTLASLRFALHHAQVHKRDRIIYVIPFTSIIDQNAQAVRAILEPPDAPADQGKVILEHHSSVTPEQQTWREKVLCENWDAPVVYTTMVQFLESLFGAGTRGARRMHQLANSVLIFDEIQTLPIKCVHLFNNAINFLAEHCNTTVVLCTATQPLLHEVAKEKGAVRLAPQHELMENVQGLFDALKRVTVKDRRKPEEWSMDEVAQLALTELQRAGSCLVIVNTKEAARNIFKLCAGELEKAEVCHLSTDMCPAHRKRELAKIRLRLAEHQRILCVSTQLIEAGVDVDFGVVIRFTAGLDSIAQAAGRCNRNGRPEPGIVHVVNPREENLTKLPDIKIGREKTVRVLDDYSKNSERYSENLMGPVALGDYYRYYFFERQDDMDYKLSAKELGHTDTLLNLLSLNDQAVSDYQKRKRTAPDCLFRQAFMSAAKAFKSIDAPTRGIIVPFGEEGDKLITDLHAAFEIEKAFGLLRTAQQYTVNVFPHVLQKLTDEGAVHGLNSDPGILCLDKRYYSQQFGLATEPVSLLELLHV